MLLISSKFSQHSSLTYPCNKLASETGMAYVIADETIWGEPSPNGWFVIGICLNSVHIRSSDSRLTHPPAMAHHRVFYRTHVQPLMASSSLKEHMVMAHVRPCLHFLPQHRTRNWSSGDGVRRVLKSQKEVYKTNLLLLNGVPSINGISTVPAMFYFLKKIESRL